MGTENKIIYNEFAFNANSFAKRSNSHSCKTCDPFSQHNSGKHSYENKLYLIENENLYKILNYSNGVQRIINA